MAQPTLIETPTQRGQQLIKGKDALFKQLLCDGIDTIFGNPGTVEEAVIDTLPDYPDMRYIMGLQEAAITSVGDAYARATKKPAFVQVHASVGLGNAMGILYASKQCYTPLVMYAGETYADLLDFYGFLGGDTVALAKPVTKWADRVSHPSQLLRNIRRAIKIAMTPPQGPVFLAIPMNVLDSLVVDDIKPTSMIQSRVLPEPSVVNHVADLLKTAKNPLILIGDQVDFSGGNDAVHELSHLVGAPVYGCDYSQVSASCKDPLFMGFTGHLFADRTTSITRQADVVIAVGTPLFPELFPTHEPYFNEDAKLVQIDLNDWELGKNFSTDTALRSDPKLTLEAIIARVKTNGGPDTEVVRQRTEQWTQRKLQERGHIEQIFDSKMGQAVMSPAEAMKVVASNLPENVAVFDESVTGIQTFLHYFQPENPGDYFMARGGCLGEGLPGGVGLKLAYPDRPVAALSGDGAAMYTNQALWTAAHYNLDVTFFIFNNGTYRILKTNLVEYWKRENLEPRPFHNLDLSDPPIDFVKLAESMGVQAVKVDSPDTLAKAVQDAYSQSGSFYEQTGPKLIEVIIDGSVNPNESTFV